MAAGNSIIEILCEDYYPDITETDGRACIAYASQMIRDDVIVPGS